METYRAWDTSVIPVFLFSSSYHLCKFACPLNKLSLSQVSLEAWRASSPPQWRGWRRRAASVASSQAWVKVWLALWPNRWLELWTLPQRRHRRSGTWLVSVTIGGLSLLPVLWEKGDLNLLQYIITYSILKVNWQTCMLGWRFRVSARVRVRVLLHYKKWSSTDIQRYRIWVQSSK